MNDPSRILDEHTTVVSSCSREVRPLDHRLLCKIRPRYLCANAMASSILTWSHAATNTQPIPEHCLFVASLVPNRGPLGFADRRLLAVHQIAGTQQPWMRYEVEISASYQELALHRNTCKCAPGGYSFAKRIQPRFLNIPAAISLRLNFNL